MQRPHRIFFVHVGKTGGETLRQTLKKACLMRKNPFHQEKCRDSFANTTETALSKHTIGMMHCNEAVPKRGLDRATTMLWTLRNPVTRVMSFFRYMNPTNCNPEVDYDSVACNMNRSIYKKKKGSRWSIKFFACFPTINHFAYALQNSSSFHSNNCSQLAWRTIRGESSTSSGHMYFNHKFYWKETVAKYPKMDVWVARTEYLWQDLDRIEMLLGQRNATTNIHHSKKSNVTHGSEGHVQKDELSEASQLYLCCALKEEIGVYGRLLERATNLEDSARNQSLWAVSQQCGTSSWESFGRSVCNS